MKRRTFIAALGVGAFWPPAGRAQQPKTATIGILVPGNLDPTPFVSIFKEELRRLGYLEGQNLQFEFRTAEGKMDALPALKQADAGHDWLAAPETLRQALDEDLVAALKSLNESERTVLLLRAIGEFRYAEIAESLGIPLGSVMGHLSRARKKMRSALRRFQPRTTL